MSATLDKILVLHLLSPNSALLDLIHIIINIIIQLLGNDDDSLSEDRSNELRSETDPNDPRVNQQELLEKNFYKLMDDLSNQV